jgi:hypothetical protein
MEVKIFASNVQIDRCCSTNVFDMLFREEDCCRCVLNETVDFVLLEHVDRGAGIAICDIELDG